MDCRNGNRVRYCLKFTTHAMTEGRGERDQEGLDRYGEDVYCSKREEKKNIQNKYRTRKLQKALN